VLLDSRRTACCRSAAPCALLKDYLALKDNELAVIGCLGAAGESCHIHHPHALCPGTQENVHSSSLTLSLLSDTTASPCQYLSKSTR